MKQIKACLMTDYDSFSSDYDRFVSWPGRLAFEMPFIEQTLASLGQAKPTRVLDSACGTGMHALELARRGYAAAGADISTGMIAQTRLNAQAAALDVDFSAAGFGELARAFDTVIQPFDALLCLGNSLPHVASASELSAALADFSACLRPGGLLLLQNRNFDAVVAARERWMEPQSSRDGGHEWVFIRFYDFTPDGMIQFNILTLERLSPDAAWTQKITLTRLFPLLAEPLSQALASAGFGEITLFGSMTGTDFNPASSGNLVITARKR